jgi:hypothetical protein
MVDLASLRVELHQALDRTLDEFLAEDPESEDSFSDAVIPGEITGEWTYRWPGGDEEKFFKTRWYEADGERGSQRVRVAWARRPAWGRQDRQRAVVFNQLGGPDSSTYYPWAEFVETDDGRCAASIPNPQRPRASLADFDSLPGRFSECTVERTDALFDSVADGPSLRLVVSADDEPTMVRHGYWVATLRRRI